MSGEPGDDLAELRRIVRHDLRSPVTIIVGRADLLLSGVQGALNDEQRRSLEAIVASAERVDRMARDVAERIDRVCGRAAGGASDPKGQ
ncbi:MAG: histidine kinase dimerization/phospho-acceptor domain-containing protein [Myxococcota bacterium]